MKTFAWEEKSPDSSSGAIQQGVLQKKKGMMHLTNESLAWPRNEILCSFKSRIAKTKIPACAHLLFLRQAEIRYLFKKDVVAAQQFNEQSWANNTQVPSQVIRLEQCFRPFGNARNLGTKCCINKDVGSLEVTWRHANVTLQTSGTCAPTCQITYHATSQIRAGSTTLIVQNYCISSEVTRVTVELWNIKNLILVIGELDNLDLNWSIWTNVWPTVNYSWLSCM